MVEDPSVEDRGGFEFASGMDIFSEPGVVKACYAMAPVTLGAGAEPNGMPLGMVDTVDTFGALRSYVIAGSKVLESTDGNTFSLFLTNGNGPNLGLAFWAGYVVYIGQTTIGRTPLGDASTKDDNYITGLDTDSELHPAVLQAGTLKIGAGRYVASLDESFNFTARAMKLPDRHRVRAMAEHQGDLWLGIRYGYAVGGIGISNSSAFRWRGTVLSSGSALPDSAYPMSLRDMNALLSDGRILYAFPDTAGDVLAFDGAGFAQFRKITAIGRTGVGAFQVNPGAVVQHADNTVLFTGQSAIIPGVFQMREGAVCQAFVPSTCTPGVNAAIQVGFLKTSYNGRLFIGYYKNSSDTLHLEASTGDRQDGAVMRTLFHRLGTDRRKSVGGIRLNLKPMPEGTSVSVGYRTERNAAFTPAPRAVTAANQHKPLLLPARPRAQEIQFQFTYATDGESTPELVSYDILFDTLVSTR